MLSGTSELLTEMRDLGKIELFKQPHMSERALDKRLGRHVAIFCEQFLFKRAAVHADADGNLVFTAGVYDRLDAVLLRPMLPGLMRILSAPRCRRFDGETVVEVDVRDERDGR